ncbi:hypothetical protein PT286_04835 [Neisseriaceae bacterium ESL0693]|nr:hypothetical protein [Neisseriaceae bacterium ESL0693]
MTILKHRHIQPDACLPTLPMPQPFQGLNGLPVAYAQTLSQALFGTTTPHTLSSSQHYQWVCACYRHQLQLQRGITC